MPKMLIMVIFREDMHLYAPASGTPYDILDITKYLVLVKILVQKSYLVNRFQIIVKSGLMEKKKCCTFQESRLEKLYPLAFAIQNSQILMFSKNTF